MGEAAINAFSVAQTEKLAGLSRTMLDYLCRSGILQPSAKPCRGRGHRRMYSFSDLILLRVIARLLTSGISVLKLRKSFAALRKRHPEFATKRMNGAVLVTDGVRIYLRQGTQVLEDLMGGQLGFAFVIELERVRRDLGHQVGAATAPKRNRRKRQLANG